MIKVTRVFSPYTWKELCEFNVEVTRTFGKLGSRWRHSMATQNNFDNSRSISYWFNDPHDATLFVLKFGGEYHG